MGTLKTKKTLCYMMMSSTVFFLFYNIKVGGGGGGLDASKPSGHLLNQESHNVLCGNIGCKDKNSSWDIIGFLHCVA